MIASVGSISDVLMVFEGWKLGLYGRRRKFEKMREIRGLHVCVCVCGLGDWVEENNKP